jgi:hypothetical protein
MKGCKFGGKCGCGSLSGVNLPKLGGLCDRELLAELEAGVIVSGIGDSD